MSKVFEFPKKKVRRFTSCHITTLLNAAKYHILVDNNPEAARTLLSFCATTEVLDRIIMVPPEILSLVDGLDFVKLKIIEMGGQIHGQDR